MITKITIKNFQSHKRTILNLSTGINIITGTSDKGKTAILRALRWVIYNKPSGDSFRSYWGGDTIVEVCFSSGDKITRVRTNSENMYIINDNKPLKAFGQGVPEEVTRIINMQEVNLQQQFDQPFLISETAGDVAVHFNKLAGISVIDRSITKAKNTLLKTRQSIAQRKEDLKEKREQLVKYETLPDLEKHVADLNTLDNKRKETKRAIGIIRSHIQTVSMLNKEIKEVDSFVMIEPVVNDVLEKVDAKRKLVKDFNKLQALTKHHKVLDENIAENEKFIEVDQTVNMLMGKANSLRDFKGDVRKIKTLVGKATTLEELLQKNAEIIKKLQAKVPVTCPVCGGTGKLK